MGGEQVEGIELGEEGPGVFKLVGSDDTVRGIAGATVLLLKEPDQPPAPREGERNGRGSSTPTVEAIREGLAALAEPADVWRHLARGEAAELARATLADLREDRATYAKRASWVFAPEMVLLDMAPAAARGELAKQMLEARAGIREQDVEMARARVAIEEEKPALEAARARLAETVTGIAAESIRHMEKWRQLADLGIAVLCATTLFSMLAIAYLLLFLVPRDHVDGEVAALVIFTLAVFIASPSVLLLRERPLKGVDQWMPGGKASEEREEARDSPRGDADRDGAARRA